MPDPARNFVMAGDLRHRITLQQRSETRDALGQQSTTWADYLTVWADVQPLSGRELFSAQAVQSEVTHEITIRWREEFADPRALARMRVLFQGRVFNVQSAVTPFERKVMIIMQAAEGLNQG